MYGGWHSRSAVRSIAIGFALALSLGPWTRDVFRRLGASEYEAYAVSTMAATLARRAVATFATEWTFSVVPLLFLLVRSCCPRAAGVVQLGGVLVAQATSVACLPLIFVLENGASRDAPHAMGDVLVADAVTMLVIHCALIACDALPGWTLACGPLFGLGHSLRRSHRPSSILAGVAALYANVGALHRAYRTMSAQGNDTLVHTLPLSAWSGVEVYAAVTVVGGFLVICSSLPAIRTPCSRRRLAEAAELLAYTVLLNGNVAAAWIASTGVWRAPLVTVMPLACRCAGAAQSRDDARPQRRARARSASRA